MAISVRKGEPWNDSPWSRRRPPRLALLHPSDADRAAMRSDPAGLLAQAVDPDDPVAALRAVQLLRGSLDSWELDAVRRIRASGASWAVVGDVLGITRQAADSRFRTRLASTPTPKTPWWSVDDLDGADDLTPVELAALVPPMGARVQPVPRKLKKRKRR